MIVIDEPQIKRMNHKSRLTAGVRIPEDAFERWVKHISALPHYNGYEKIYNYKVKEFELWYEVEHEFEQFLCTERSDSFVLAVLYFAMVTGEDIRCLGKISQEFYHNINTYLIPLQCNERTEYRRIRVIADLDDTALETRGENATGISCGVDSFDTILEYMSKEMDKSHRLSLVTIFNVGAYESMPDMRKCINGEMSLEKWEQKIERYFKEEIQRGKFVAEKLGLRFLDVNSNLTVLYRGVFLQSHAYRNASVVLALQKLFGHYYYASAGEPTKDIAGLDKATSDNVHYFSTDTVRFYLGGVERTRIEKTKRIAQNDVARKYLHVCCDEIYNCGKCGKCFRTLLIAEITGELDKFKLSFPDLSAYQKKHWKKYVWILDKKSENDFFAKDIFDYMKKNNLKIPCVAWLYHYTLPLRKIIRKLGIS